MSLLASIFGGTATPSSGEEGAAAAPDLFASKEAQQPKTDGDGSSDSGDDSSSSEPSSDSEPEQDAEAEDKSQATDIPSKNITKKTKEQLKEEEDRTIFVGNLPADITRRALANIFKPCGSVASARLRSMAVAGVKLPPEQAGNQNMMRKVCVNTGKVLGDTPKKSAQGYVVFKSAESVEKALQLNSTAYQQHTLRVDRANPTVEPSRSVFVGNLPYGTDEETLRDHFLSRLNEEEDLNEREGSPVAGVRIIRDKETQKCKGFGYVTLRDATLVPPALQLHGSTYMKRELRVVICGKRCKGNRGEEGKRAGRRSFEGQRATESSHRKPKRQSEEGGSGGGGGGGKAKRRRARSDKKAAPGATAGMSKRAAAERRVNQRVKKLKKRQAKGMGKKKA
ncbi:hypothetical protein ACHAXT_012205 [Thalassiosira profunda]